jgi:hypothetical protein
MQDGFGVAVGPVDVAALLEFRAKIGVVVDLTVEYDLERAVFVGHGLMAGGNIDDTQATVTEAELVFDENAGVVGPAMRHHVSHALQDVTLHVASGTRG